MPSYQTGTVTEVLSERPGLQRVMVDGRPAYVLTPQRRTQAAAYAARPAAERKDTTPRP